MREAAKLLAGYLARGDKIGLDGFRCQPDVLYHRPPFLPSSLVAYPPTAADSDPRPAFTRPNRRGAEPYSDMPATKVVPTFNQGDRKQVFWPSMSKRLYGSSGVNPAVQVAGVASSATRGIVAPQPCAFFAPHLPSLASSLPPSKGLSQPNSKGLALPKDGSHSRGTK